MLQSAPIFNVNSRLNVHNVHLKLAFGISTCF